mmetsp:Transcript_1453/g.4060  ORF Transcript_1453/g.4060 Transcript_1453/m.4060 type:complete len:99 (+) Transcript_1453:3938-4234(+)
MAIRLAALGQLLEEDSGRPEQQAGLVLLLREPQQEDLVLWGVAVGDLAPVVALVEEWQLRRHLGPPGVEVEHRKAHEHPQWNIGISLVTEGLGSRKNV